MALFFAPPDLRPGWDDNHPPSRASLFLLQWEWFRIYFESGLVKLLSGDTEWRHLTAMDEYYQNGPLPTWIGWYVQHLPHWFHWATAFCHAGAGTGHRLDAVSSPPLAHDLFSHRHAVGNWRDLHRQLHLSQLPRAGAGIPVAGRPLLQPLGTKLTPRPQPRSNHRGALLTAFGIAGSAVLLTLVGYVTTVELISMVFGRLPLPMQPVTMLEPFRIANQYGLFAVMTRGRYEIEFQGSRDGQAWTAYPFRFKPQALDRAPGIYAPYQPRFEWNLWFASLGSWQQNPLVPRTEERLLTNDPDVLALFAAQSLSC